MAQIGEDRPELPLIDEEPTAPPAVGSRGGWGRSDVHGLIVPVLVAECACSQGLGRDAKLQCLSLTARNLVRIASAGIFTRRRSDWPEEGGRRSDRAPLDAPVASRGRCASVRGG